MSFLLYIGITIGVALVFWLIFLVSTIRNLKKMDFLPTNTKIKTKHPPFISVIIPTRNEAHRVKNCIKTLKNQTYPKFEVIVVDDSTDNTVEIIKNIVKDDSRFRIIKQKKLPKGWVGKSYALQQAAKLAKGKWLLFIDADVSLHPRVIENALYYAIKKKLDMLSLIPHLICKTFWEKVIQPVVGGLILFLCPPSSVSDPKSKVAFAMGPFILIRKDVFDKVGGYKKIKDKITDDVELARLVKYSGFKTALINGQEMLHLRMYRDFKDLWMGWSKNVFLGFNYIYNINSKILRFLVAIGGALAIFTVISLPSLVTMLSGLAILLNIANLVNLFLLSLISWITTILIQVYLHKVYRGYPKYSIVSFLGGLVVMAIFLNSALRVLSRKGVAWKGRIYYAKSVTQ
jgi:glycosyltransferase involved in cell wall biosynthesis